MPRESDASTAVAGQRWIGPAALAAAFALIVAARLLTLAPDPWEWDEVLFVEAVDHGIDLRKGFPHPPGYPLFVETARALHLAGVGSFRATTLVGTLGSSLASVGLAGLLLALGLSLPAATFAALLYAFLPSVWIHGVRPLSDGPAVAALLFSAACLIASRIRGRGWLLAGALLAALCAGFRPQAGITLLPLCAWAALTAWRSRRDAAGIALALAIGVGVTAAVWVPAIRGSGGIPSFLGAMKAQAGYVWSLDTLGPRDLLRFQIWKQWLVEPFGPPSLFLAVALAAAAGVAAAPRRAGTLLLVFAPVLLLTVPFSALPVAARYVAILLPVPCGLAAMAFERFFRLASTRRWALGAAALLVACSAAVAAGPVLEVARKESPSVAVARRLRDDPRFAHRPAIATIGLVVHLNRYLGTGFELLPDVRPPRIDRRAQLIALTDDLFLGQAPLFRASYENPLLGRITRDRYLAGAIYTAVPELGLPVAECRGNCWFDGRKGESEFRDGGALAVWCTEGPIRVSAAVRAKTGGAAIQVTTGEGRPVYSGPAAPIDFEAFPDRNGVLFIVRATSGAVRLSGFHLGAEPRPRGEEDRTVHGSIDRPLENEEVKGSLVVAGRGASGDGREADAVEFRLDGVRLDVGPAARPGTGTGEKGRFEVTIPRLGAAEGKHVLTVALRTRDGRSEVELHRPFRWVD